MIYCPECGSKLHPDAKYCTECGADLKDFKSTRESKNHSFDNKPLTCPQCGTPLNSFMIVCPSCGVEINKPYDTACNKLCDKLAEIENSRPGETLSSMILNGVSRNRNSLKPTDMKKIETILGFIVPNTKADIMEFLFLADTRVSQVTLCHSEYESNVYYQTKRAWRTKLEQVMQKAEMILKSDPDFVSFRDTYMKRKYISQMKCQYCGGSFTGLFSKVCKQCGKPKDYADHLIGKAREYFLD